MYRTSTCYHIRALKYIRSSISTNMARTLASVLVNTRLDYANSLLMHSTHSENMSKLQRVQNSFARVVTYTKLAELIHPVLHQLLPVNYHINYKVVTLAYKVRSTRSPAYLLPSVSDYAPTRNQRSSSHCPLNVPAVETQIAWWVFIHAAPSVWNIRQSDCFHKLITWFFCVHD